MANFVPPSNSSSIIDSRYRAPNDPRSRSRSLSPEASVLVPPKAPLLSQRPHTQDGGSNSAEKPLPEYPAHNKRENFGFRWRWEIPSCVISVLSIIAIAIILREYDGRPLPKWPYKITINALVSVLTTLLKAGMLVVISEGLSQAKWLHFHKPRHLSDLNRFDTASRGAWGAFRLLLIRTEPIAILGAVITIIAIAIDPFTQQTVGTTSCGQPLGNEAAAIPVARDIGSASTGIIDFAVDQPRDMENQLYSGIMGAQDLAQAVSPACLTGNCTFPDEYSSLAMCSSCWPTIYDIIIGFANETGMIQVDQDPSSTRFAEPKRFFNQYMMPYRNYGSGSNLTLQQPAYFQDSDVDVAKFSSWSVPEGDDLFGNVVINMTMLSFTSQACTTDWMPGGTRHPDTDCYSPAAHKVLRDVAPPDSGLGGPMPVLGPEHWNNVTAYRCNLSMCLNTYKASVTAGRKTETLISSSPVSLLIRNITQSDIYGLLPYDCSINGTHYNLTEIINTSNKSMVEARHRLSSFRDPGILQQCGQHTFNKTSLQGMANYLAFFLEGNGTEQRYSWNYDPSTFAQPGNPSFFSPIWLEPVFNNGTASLSSVRAKMASIAEAMTNYLRMSDPTNSTAPGITMTTQTCVKAQYVWLVLPVALVFATCIFLVALIIQSIRGFDPARKVWKSNILAVLFHGIDVPSQNPGCEIHARGVDEPERMDKLAESVKTKLEQTREGWRFVRAS